MVGYFKLNTDGTIQGANLQHDGFLSMESLAKDAEGKVFTYYEVTPDANGIYQADTAKIDEVYSKATIAHFKGMYLEVVNTKLAELDYDSLATVKLWEGDSLFGAEATKILTWYKAIIAYNYGLISGGTIPTDEVYISGIPVYV